MPKITALRSGGIKPELSSPGSYLQTFLHYPCIKGGGIEAGLAYFGPSAYFGPTLEVALAKKSLVGRWMGIGEGIQ